MSLILQIYLVITCAYLLWNVFVLLFEDEVVRLNEVPMFLLYPCVMLGIGKYTIDGFSAQLGGWSTAVTVVLTIGVVFMAFISIMSFGSHEPEDKSEAVIEDNEQDLDGCELTVEEQMEKTGEQMAQVFRENTSALEKMAALGEMAEAQEDEEDNLSLTDKLMIATGAVLYTPALVLNYLA